MKFVNVIVLAAVALQQGQGAAGRRTGRHWHKKKNDWSGSLSTHKPIRVKKVKKISYAGSKSGKSSKGSYGYHDGSNVWSGSLVKLCGYGKSSKAKWHVDTYDDEDDWAPGWPTAVEGHHKKRNRRKWHKSKSFVSPISVCDNAFPYLSLLTCVINGYHDDYIDHWN